MNLPMMSAAFAASAGVPKAAVARPLAATGRGEVQRDGVRPDLPQPLHRRLRPDPVGQNRLDPGVFEPGLIGLRQLKKFRQGACDLTKRSRDRAAISRTVTSPAASRSVTSTDLTWLRSENENGSGDPE